MNIRSRVVIGSAVLALLGLMSSPHLSFGSDESRAKDIILQTCVQCHRLEGQTDSRFNLKAPDLIWAGSKYQRPWLILLRRIPRSFRPSQPKRLLRRSRLLRGASSGG
jgi:hypothetical protein